MTLRFTSENWKDHPEQAEAAASGPVRSSIAQDQGESQASAFVDSAIQTTGFVPSFGVAGERCAVHVPKNYERNYAYPLVVWLHGAGSSERELPEIMRQISPQNFIGIAFRGTLPGRNLLPVGFRWSQSEQAMTGFKDVLYQSVCQLRREYHIHSERIFIAGFDDGGRMALRMLLDHPEWFAGAMVLCGGLPETKTPLHRFRDLRHKHLLMATGSQETAASRHEAAQTSRLLYSAGMRVSFRAYDAARELTPQMLADVNRWTMESFCVPV